MLCHAEKIFGDGNFHKFWVAWRRASIFTSGGGVTCFQLAAAAEFGGSGL